MAIKTLLVESDEALRAELTALLSFHPHIEIVAHVDTTEQAFDFVKEHEIHMVFSNVMPAPAQFTSDGSWLAIFLAEYYPDIQVVLYGEPDKLLDGASVSVCSGVLTLPFDSMAFPYVIKRLSDIFQLQQYKREAVNRSIMVKTRDGYQMLALRDILFIERSDRKNRIVMDSGKEILLYRYTLDELEQQLQGSGFYRCYQSFIVNLSKIAGIRADKESKSYAIVFDGNRGEIMLSRSKYAQIVELLRERYAKVSL